MSPSGYPFVVDHVFVAVAAGAPEVDRLVEAGFAEGPPNRHPGQGTACRRVFFSNLYLEFIWLEDAVEATSALVAPTALALRCRPGSGASRLGVALRPAASVEADPEAIPLETWSYRPPYLPPGWAIPVATPPESLTHPLVFFMPGPGNGHRPAAALEGGAASVSNVTLRVPATVASGPVCRWLGRVPGMTVAAAPGEGFTVELDGGGPRRLDLAPDAPLELRW